MWKALIIGSLATLASASSALACSCSCQFDMHVSDYVRGAQIFWGIPIESRYEQTIAPNGRPVHKVISRVKVIEGYNRLQNGAEITLNSSPDDGASCGVQLNTGVTQFIVAGSNNGLSSCACPPPAGYLLDYLKDGKDRYLPDLNDCWDNKNENQRYKQTKKCKVWADAPDDYSAEHSERMNMYRRMRGEAE